MRCYVSILMVIVFVVGCTHADKTQHVSQANAVTFLAKEGLLQNKEQVVSAEWRQDLGKWLIVVNYPSTNETSQAYWFVNADATEYSGGTCQQ